jgi:hypothetical protein
MSSWNDLIDQAFVDLGTIQVGESISAGMRTDAQTRFNQLLSSLSTEGLTVFNQVMQSFTLTAATVAYTLGSGGSFATTGSLRAVKVTAWRASYAGVLTGGGDILSMAEFGARAVQMAGEVSSIPKMVAADTAYPLINVRVFPPPSTAPGSLELAYYTPITQVTDFTATVALPEGWNQLLHFNLAVALSPQYTRQGGISQELAANAQNSKAVIVAQNTIGAPPPPKAA